MSQLDLHNEFQTIWARCGDPILKGRKSSPNKTQTVRVLAANPGTHRMEGEK